MTIDRTKTLKELTARVEAIVESQRHHSDSRRNRVSTSNPAPEGEHVVGVDSECFNLFRACAARDHMKGDSLLTKAINNPLAQRAGVEHGLSGGERLGNDDHHGTLCLQAPKSTLDSDWIDVREEAKSAALGSFCSGTGRQSFGNKLSTKIRASNAHSDDVGYRLSSGTLPGSRAYLLREGFNLGENFMYGLHYILTIDFELIRWVST
mmetsp:Transcript_12263/g.19425  ORF Transcript_12263/g.19425 Transcript_12263/m.19425 type:complete len:208 (-) Transcript_12263:378-1001(-)